MSDVIGQINWLGVAASTLAMAILGALWFTALFGKAYTYGEGVDAAAEHDTTRLVNEPGPTRKILCRDMGISWPKSPAVL